VESCNGVDDDCDGLVDDPEAEGCTLWYADLDGDGYGVQALVKCLCGPTEFHTASLTGDCKPLDPDVHPGAEEACNGVDDDCTGTVDDGFPDLDGDGKADCVDPDDDGDGAPDLQDNCPATPNADQADFDEDGTGDACDPDDDGDQALDEADCAPFDATVHPGGTEVCDAKDNDCDGEIDEELGLLACGLGECFHVMPACAGGESQFCDPMEGAVEELCDGLDNDCDGQTDEELGETTCGLGLCLHTVPNCSEGIPQVCNPKDGADEETCDGLDNDCDGQTDEELGQLACGLGECFHVQPACAGGESQLCDPMEGEAQEVCDSLDNDCDGQTDEELGETTCGLGLCLHTVANCSNGVPQVCDPQEGADEEICDGLDNDCDGQSDEGFDLDEDGFTVCQGDCDDGNAESHPEADESCYDEVDNDCDGAVDDGCILISNVPEAWVLEATGPLSIETGTVAINTDTGEISPAVRPAGVGTLNGIYFAPFEQAGGPTVGVFAVTQLQLSEGAVLNLTGSRPAVLLVAGETSIAGKVSLAGAKGNDGDNNGPNPGGAGVLGGGNGGSGSNNHYAGATAGSGTGHGFLGIAGVHYGNGGGGAGYCAGGGGGMGDRPSVAGKPGTLTAGGAGGYNGGDGGRGGNGGNPYGGADLTPLVPGSGGAGGYSDTDWGPSGAGGGGGAGGGALQISSVGPFVLEATGTLDASGGPGGNAWGGGGGGGSGGALLIEAPELVVAGTLLARGGKGGDGCIPWANSGDGGYAGGAPEPLWGGGGAIDSGGGGGASGRIRLNAGPDGLLVTGTSQPPLDSACATSGDAL
jgi:hypothetical protein